MQTPTAAAPPRRYRTKGTRHPSSKVPKLPIVPPSAPTPLAKRSALISRQESVAATIRARPAITAIAREVPEVFMRYVLEDERTGKPICSATDDELGLYPAMHDEWQDILSAHPRVVMWSHVEAGKTNQITIGRVLWELGRNPGLRIVIVSRTNEMAKKLVRAIGQYITKSEKLHAVFPHLREANDKSLPWTSTMLTVERDGFSKDPSVQAFGHGGAINGSRVDLVIVDDILDWKNTRTEAQREEVWTWLQSMVISRFTEDARLWVLGNAWHPRDAMHRFAAIPGYVSFRYPVMSAEGELSWPKQWPQNRIDARRNELGPFEFPRAMLCMAREDSDARFKKEWIDKALMRGRGFTLVTSIDHDHWHLRGYRIFTGVDLAVEQHSKADWTVFFTILLHPDGTRQVLNIERGRWAGPDIVRKLLDVHRRFGGLIVVENVAAQNYIVQFAHERLDRSNVKGFKTGKQKAHPEYGVEGLSIELDGGKWLIPNRVDTRYPDSPGVVAPDVDVWITEMLHYQPGEHTGDCLMAAWFAREAARAYEVTATRRQAGGGVGLRVIGGGKVAQRA